jgi:hypothetical protein
MLNINHFHYPNIILSDSLNIMQKYNKKRNCYKISAEKENQQTVAVKSTRRVDSISSSTLTSTEPTVDIHSTSSDTVRFG